MQNALDGVPIKLPEKQAWPWLLARARARFFVSYMEKYS